METELMSIVINVVSGVLVTLLAGGVVGIIYNRYRFQTRVHRIVHPNDRNIHAFNAIYTRLFPDNEMAATSDMMRWLYEYQQDRKQRDHTLEEYYLLIIVAGKPHAIANFQYYTDSKYMFLSYFGNPRSQKGLEPPGTQNRVATAFRTYLGKLLTTELRNCRAVVYETDMPSAGEISDRERAKRHARVRIFRSYAASLGLISYQLPILYIAPKLDLDPRLTYVEEQLVLNYVPLKGQVVRNALSRTEVVAVLSFIYNQVYGDSHKEDPAKDLEYRKYVAGLYQRLADIVPLEVGVHA